MEDFYLNKNAVTIVSITVTPRRRNPFYKRVSSRMEMAEHVEYSCFGLFSKIGWKNARVSFDGFRGNGGHFYSLGDLNEDSLIVDGEIYHKCDVVLGYVDDYGNKDVKIVEFNKDEDAYSFVVQVEKDYDCNFEILIGD